MQNEAQKRLISINQVTDITDYGKTSIYTLMKTQGFPKPINIGNRTKRWIESEVQDWIEFQIENSRGAA